MPANKVDLSYFLKNNAPPLVVFDGDCLLCNATVQKILNHEKTEELYFTTLNSALGKSILEIMQHQHMQAPDSILFLKDGKIYTRSAAVKSILDYMNGFAFLKFLLKILPLWFCDIFYRLIAKSRFFIFGKNKSCFVPPSTWAHRFMTSSSQFL